MRRRRPVSPLLLSTALLLVPASRVAFGQSAPAQPEVSAPRIEARPLQGLKAEVAALILSGREGGELWAAALAAPFPGEQGRWNVDFWIEIDGSRLLGEERTVEDRDEDDAEDGVAEDGVAEDGIAEGGVATATESLRVEVHAYAITAGGVLKAHSSDSFRMPKELAARLAEGGVKYSGKLEVEPGEYDLRILVRERRSERFVLRILPLEVPGPDAGRRALLLPPFFADVEGAWIEVVGSAPPASPYWPAALPVLAAGRSSTARLEIAGPRSEPPRVVLRVLDEDRQAVGELEAELADAPGEPFPEPRRRPLGGREGGQQRPLGGREGGQQRPLGGRGGELQPMEMSFGLPGDMLTGNYLLETALDGESATARITRIFVLGLEREERELVWTDIQRLGALSERRREALELAAKQRAKKRVAVIAEAYRGVLERLASGSIAAAGGELERLENEVMEAPESEARSWLGNAEDHVISKLAEIDAESLIPVLHLHMEAHGRYTDTAAQLTFHARQRVIEAARLYAEKSASEMASILAASALADMGASLHDSGMWVGARQMMEEALALDERNLTALLGLGLDHERRGEYEEAVSYLTRLVEIDPRAEEGRLRLAMNLRRAGDSEAASRHLRRVIDDGATEWLLTIAYQELARSFADRGGFGRAARLLEDGLRRLPGESRLYVQLAYVLDRMGESQRARETIRATPAGTPDSPRLRYSRDYGQETAVQPALARQSMARLATLAGALTRIGEER